MRKVKKMFNIFGFRKPLSREAFEAYYDRLPSHIEVSWFRDDGYIIGNVVAGENQFMTQGKNASDFIEMVNDAVVAVNRIPKDYFDVVKEAHTYNPPVEQIKLLEDNSVKKAIISLVKNREVLETVK